MKNSATVQITKIEEKPSNFGIFNTKPAKFARTHTTERGVCLYVEAIDETGKSVHFWTPQAVISTTTGMLHFQSLTKNTGLFYTEHKGEMKGYKSCFEGDVIMPVVIEDKTKVVPAIEVGQVVEIQFKEEEEKFNSRRLKNVRLKQNQ